MSIPQYQEFMKPALQALQDGSVKHRDEIEDFVAPILGLSSQERKELLPSGRKPIVRNRLHWALYYMYRAGLVNRPKRATFQITEAGLKALASGENIDVKFLEAYPQFRDFQNISHANDGNENIDLSSENAIDPDESINNAIERKNKKTCKDILDYMINNIDEIRFEEICLDLMKAMGYADTNNISLTKKSHDRGIDGIVKQDALGLDIIYTQSKKYTPPNKVNEVEVRNFIGALDSVSKGVFFTTSFFSETAKEKANRASGKKIILVDGEEMARLMLKYNVGVRTKEKYEVKEFDEDYFLEDE